MPASIKILTYNIHKGMSAANHRFVLHSIRDALRRQDADVVLLQEVHGDHSSRRKNIHNWPDNDQLAYLSENTWPHVAYGKNAIYRRGHHGNAVLSKSPLLTWRNIDVSLARKHSRSLLHTELQWPHADSKLHIICVHLGLFSFEREQQLATLSQHVLAEIPENEPLIIAGDFNDWRSRAGAHLHDGFGLSEVFQHHEGRLARTFPAWLPVFKMDRVYSRGLQVKGYEQLRGKPWQMLSDHIPLLVEFELASPMPS